MGHAVCHSLRSAVNAKGEAEYRVFATDLRVEDMADLEHDGFETLHMDVTNDLSVANAVENVLEAAGRIDALVCDAGVLTAGAIIDQRVEAAHQALDINVLGFLRLVQVQLFPPPPQKPWLECFSREVLLSFLLSVGCRQWCR